MVIGANIGTTITVILGSLGGIPAKKRVALSHLTFNIITGTVAFVSIKWLVWIVSHAIDINTNAVMGLALFHTIFNIIGVILFLPFIGLLARMLNKIFPDEKAILTVYINNTPTEIIEAASTALKNEIIHLLHECQLYGIRILRLDKKSMFEQDLPLEKSAKKKLSLDNFYEKIKLLHGEIFAYYSKLQSHKREETEVKQLERMVFASRNIMNSIKNFKGIRYNLDEFDGSDSAYLNEQYNTFRKRLLKLYNEMKNIQTQEDKEGQYHNLLKAFVKIEEADKKCINETISAAAEGRIEDLEISSLLLANRLFTQACRLQIFSLKDLLPYPEQINNFDRALDMKEIIESEKDKNS
jgi:phosphate:Na+ symporter